MHFTPEAPRLLAKNTDYFVTDQLKVTGNVSTKAKRNKQVLKLGNVLFGYIFPLSSNNKLPVNSPSCTANQKSTFRNSVAKYLYY